MTTGNFKYIDPASLTSSTAPSKPWAKVDGPGTSFTYTHITRDVTNLRGQEPSFTTDSAGFSLHKSPLPTSFSDPNFRNDAAVRNEYYPSIISALKTNLPSGQRVKKVVIFDHTIRRRDKDSPRQPVQQVHVDQTPKAAEARVRRHLPAEEADELLKGRYQIINVWRPIENPASDFPLAVVDWRSTTPKDFVEVDLLYPKRDSMVDDGDDRGKETVPATEEQSTEGYEVKGETFAVQPSDGHKFYYLKDMDVDEIMFIKCFDSRSETVGNKGSGRAHCTPHTAFVDPQTPEDAPGRQSIEVRCLIFYE